MFYTRSSTMDARVLSFADKKNPNDDSLGL